MQWTQSLSWSSHSGYWSHSRQRETLLYINSFSQPSRPLSSRLHSESQSEPRFQEVLTFLESRMSHRKIREAAFRRHYFREVEK